MRVAVILIGQYRTFPETRKLFFENVADRFEGIEFEFFARFSKTTDLDYNVVSELSRDHRFKIVAVADKSILDSIDCKHNAWGYDEDRIKNGYYQSIKGQQEAFEYIRQYNKDLSRYDMVFYLRTDYHIREPLNLTESDPSQIYIPAGEDHLTGINDQCYWGNPQMMEMICNRVDIYIKPGCTRHPELFLKEIIEEADMPLNRPTINCGIGR